MTDENKSQDALAKKISDILTDKNISTDERVEKMKQLLNNKSEIPTEQLEDKQNPSVSNQTTYSNKDIQKAALRNKLLNKKK